MLRVAVACSADFHDQATVQRALLELRAIDTGATIIIGTRKGEVLAGKVWQAFGGHVVTKEPEWHRYSKPVEAMKARDAAILNEGVDFVIALCHGTLMPYLALDAKMFNVKVKSYYDDHDVIDA